MVKALKLRNKKGTNRALTLISAFVIIGATVGVALFSLTGTRAASGSGTLYISPGSGSYSVGSTVTVTIREDSGSTTVNGVEADFNYPANLLTYESYNVSASGFNYPGPAPTLSSGSFQYGIFSTAAVTGDQEALTVTFKVIAPGTASLSFQSSAAVAGSAGSENPTESGASFTIPTPAPVVAPTPTPTPTPTPVTTVPTNPGSGSGTTTSKKPAPTVAADPVATAPIIATAITPSGSPTAVQVPNGSNVQVSAPARVSPAAQPRSTSPTLGTIVKVAYFLNKKLLATVTTAPYSYNLRTTSILNGEYAFITKTYYSSGTVTSSTENLSIKNPESLRQVGLAAQRYAGPSAAVLIAIAAGIFFLFHGSTLISYYRRNRRPAFATVSARDPDLVSPHALHTPQSGVVPEPNQIIRPGNPTSFPSTATHGTTASQHPPVQAPGAVYKPAEEPKGTD